MAAQIAGARENQAEADRTTRGPATGGSEEPRRKDLLILLLGSMGAVRTRTRLEKMAFLCDKNTFKRDPYYSDWKPHYYGPFSEALLEDARQYRESGHIEIKKVDDAFANSVEQYSLTTKGRSRLSRILPRYGTEPFEIRQLLQGYQSQSTNYPLLKFVYENYPKYTGGSLISREILG